jgi:endonuclease-3
MTLPLPAPVQKTLVALRNAFTKTPEAFVVWSNPLELVVGTVLSAQCTDKRVNAVTPTLFATYKTAVDYAAADLHQLERIIFSTGFYHSKARYLKGIGERLLAAYHGQVPASFDDLITLPGVSRKTAHLIMAKAFGQPTGVAVDTHVRRLAPRLGWAPATKSVAIIERALNALIPPADYLDANEYLILLGRSHCLARPRCDTCPIAHLCPTGRKNQEKPAYAKSRNT